MSAEEAVVLEQEAAPAGKARGKGLVWITIVLLLAAGGAGGAWYAGLIPGTGIANEPADADATDRRQPIYHTLDSNLVVNFRGGSRTRYLQVGIEVMSRDPKAIEALRSHNAVIRNNLIMLLSDQNSDALATREGKENLQREALAEIQAVLQARYGEPGIESLYFTSFVMQ
ncbi:MAG: flagellar basal body-associated FliL family protein [Gammaproteobacteria bacterium]|nr:flagellar basal body-associated FliL family protein [Gammaproteobacteria bacterium]